MNRVAASMFLALSALAPSPAWGRAAAKAGAGVQCPTVSVSCAETATRGMPGTFTVSVTGGAASAQLTFNWVVSAGVITSGLGTSTITVDTTGLPDPTVEATVEVGGLPEGCPKTASCVTAAFAYVCGYTRPIDSYGDISFEHEQARLDNYAIELQNDPLASGYIVAYDGRRTRAGAARRRAERAKGYLVKRRGLDAARLFIVEGGHREELTVDVFIWPRDVDPPTPTPTVDLSEVEIVPDEARPARRPRRRN